MNHDKSRNEINGVEMEQKWDRNNDLDFNYRELFHMNDISDGDFMVCCLLGFHRCLPEVLWDAFKKMIKYNKHIYQRSRDAMSNSVKACEIDIGFVLSNSAMIYYGPVKLSGVKYTNKHNKRIRGKIYKALVYAVKSLGSSDGSLLDTLYDTRNDEHKLIVCICDVKDYNTHFKLSGVIHHIIDVSLQLPTGTLSLIKSTSPAGENMPIKFIPCLYNKLLAKELREFEFGVILKLLSSELIKELIIIISEYSMDEYQMMCRCVEWEKALYMDL